VAADAHALAQLRRAGEHRRFPAHAGLAQALAKVLVEVQQAGFVTQALAVRGVADDQAFLVLVRAWLEGADFALVDLHPVAQAGTLDVVAPRLDQPRVGFVTANPQWRLGQAGLRTGQALFVNLAPCGRHMAEPGAEAPALTLEVGGNVGSDHRRLHQEGADTAHRVGKGAALGSNARPAGADQHRSGQVFLQRRGALLQAIATLVQAVAGQVEREDRLATVQAQVHADIRVDLFHRWAQALTVAQLVDDRVLDLERTEVSVVDARAMAAEFHGQGAVGSQVVGPVDGVHTIIEVVGILHREALEHQQHAVGQA